MADKVLATVGDIEITESEIQALVNKYPAEQRGYLASPQGQAQLLEQKIAYIVFSKEAMANKWDEREEFKKSIEEVKQQIFTQMFLQELFAETEASEEEMKAFYEEHKEQFDEGTVAICSHILMDSEDELKKVKTQIENKEITFEEAAQKYSNCPSKAEGGSLGKVQPGMMVPEFDKEVFEMPVKTLSDPVKTQFGYHLIWVEERSEGKIKDFEEVKGQIAQQVADSKKQAAYESKVAELRAKYDVKEA